MHIYKSLSIICILTVSSLMLRAESDIAERQHIKSDSAEAVRSLHSENTESTERLHLGTALTFEAARQKVLANDPRLSLGEALSEAAHGQVLQADTMPNPVLSIEAENFLGSGPQRGSRGLEITAGISQVIETGDKQAKRTVLARTAREQLQWDQELLLNQIQRDLHSAFVAALLAQKKVILKEEQLELLEQSAAETERLVQAARSSQTEFSRARLAVQQQVFALQRAQRELVTARQQLALLWGQTTPVKFELQGDIVLRDQLPSLSDLALLLTENAALRRYDAIQRTRQAAVENEKAKAIPDVEVFAGGRYFNEDEGNYGFLLGVEIPLPLFDRNHGNILTAQAELRAVQYEQQAARRLLMNELSAAYRELQAAHEEALSLKEELLPSAEQILKETQEGYAHGRFTLLEVLSSRVALFEIKDAYLDALSRYASAEVKVESLTRPATTAPVPTTRGRIGTR